MPLNTRQTDVVKGMRFAASIFMPSFLLITYYYPSALVPESTITALTLAARWSLLPLLCLTINIQLVASQRFTSSADFDGDGLTSATAEIKIRRALLQNTLEQSLLAIGTYLVWAASLPLSWQGVIPLSAVFFTVGRYLFWRGYSYGAEGRVVGFGLTFLPSLLMLVMSCLANVFDGMKAVQKGVSS